MPLVKSSTEFWPLRGSNIDKWEGTAKLGNNYAKKHSIECKHAFNSSLMLLHFLLTSSLLHCLWKHIASQRHATTISSDPCRWCAQVQQYSAQNGIHLLKQIQAADIVFKHFYIQYIMYIHTKSLTLPVSVFDLLSCQSGFLRPLSCPKFFKTKNIPTD